MAVSVNGARFVRDLCSSNCVKLLRSETAGLGPARAESLLHTSAVALCHLSTTVVVMWHACQTAVAACVTVTRKDVSLECPTQDVTLECTTQV